MAGAHRILVSPPVPWFGKPGIWDWGLGLEGLVRCWGKPGRRAKEKAFDKFTERSARIWQDWQKLGDNLAVTMG